MSVTNIVRAVVKPGTTFTVTKPIMKEHKGQILLIEGLDLPEIYEIDFSNDRHHGSSITMIGNADGVLIPTQFIKTGKDVYAFYYYVGDNFGQTEHVFKIPNDFRPDRTDEVPEPEQESLIEQAISAVNAAVVQTSEDARTATQKASEASESAQSASISERNAANSAETAVNAKNAAEGYAADARSYKEQAASSASSANESANTATVKASEASASAITASNKADEARASAASASTDAGIAGSAAQSASANAVRAEQADASAQTSAANAHASATAASQFASQASASAVSSAQSASQSAQIKSDVQDLKSAAELSATAASQSATAASNYVSQAQTSAQSASQSETNAQGYANQAQVSAQTASTKASEASQSATTASQKATESASSASQALTYKNDAESAKTASQTAQGLAENARDDAQQAQAMTENAEANAESTVHGVLDSLTLVETSGSIIETHDAFPVSPEKMVVDIDPVQDLHGYDSPWVGGGGKNLFDATLMRDREAWYNIAVKVKPNTKYTMSTDKGTQASTGLALYFKNTNTQGGGSATIVYSDNPVTVTSTEDGYVYVSQRRVSGEDSFQNYHYQIEEGTTATDYAPYENICPISGWTGCNIQHDGKNLLPLNIWNGFSYNASVGTVFAPTISDKSWTQGENSITYETTATYTTLSLMTGLLPKGTYRCSTHKLSANSLRYTRYVLDKSFTVKQSNYMSNVTNASVAITLDEDGYIAFRLDNGSTASQTVEVTIQVEVGDTETAYEPYNGTLIPIDWETEAGTVYGCKLDVLNGMLRVEKYYGDLSGAGIHVQNDEYKLVKKSGFPYAKSVSGGVAISNVTNKFGNIPSSSYNSTKIQFPTALTGTIYASMPIDFDVSAVTFCYELATPIEIQLTPPQITLLKDYNALWADTGDISEFAYRTGEFATKADIPEVPVQDVQVNGESIVQNGIANIDLTDLEDTVESLEEDHYKSYVTDEASGAIATFDDGADDIPLKSLTVTLEPQQDFNGYGKPWVGGAEKNKCAPFEEATSTIQYRPIYVGDGTFTASSTSPWDASNATVFFLAGNVSSGASSSGNGIRPTVPVTQTAVDGYVTIAWRKVGDVDPTNYQTQIESGSVATAWTPYENICPISGWTGMNVRRCNANLWDDAWYSLGNTMTKIVDETSDFYGYYWGSVKTWNNAQLSNGLTKLFPYGVDRLTVTAEMGSISSSSAFTFRIIFYYSNGTSEYDHNIVVASRSKKTETRISQSGKKCTGFTISTNAGTGNPNGAVRRIMVSVDGTTDFIEPVQNPLIPITFGQTVYGGKLDVLSGVLRVDMAMVDMGTLTWGLASNQFYANLVGAKLGEYSIKSQALCSVYPTLSWVAFLTSGTDKACAINTGQPRINVKDSTYTDATSFKSAMSGVQLVYELAEPITIQLTPNEVNSLLGQNNIFADTGDSDVEYRADTKLYIEKLTQPEEDDMIADSAITSGQFFMIGNSLYRALANIASGATITVGTNAQRVSLSDALNLVNA